MLKYCAFFVLLLLVSVLVTSQHEKHSKDAASPSANGSHPAVAADNAKHSERDTENSKWYSPSGEFAYAVLGFPYGITVWALFLTMLVIAEQTRETARSARAAERNVTITMNQTRPRLLLKPDDFPKSVNGTLHVTLEVSNIGGSKAIFGVCLGGMEATDLGKMPTSINSGLYPLHFTNSILESSHSTHSQVKAHPSAAIFPDRLDKSKPYLIHIYGKIVFRDMLFEDVWFRDFHYGWPVLPTHVYANLREHSIPIWQSYAEEVDRMRTPPSNWAKIVKVWRTYLVWIEKQEKGTGEQAN